MSKSEKTTRDRMAPQGGNSPPAQATAPAESDRHAMPQYKLDGWDRECVICGCKWMEEVITECPQCSPVQSKTTDDKTIRAFRWLIMDALNHAIGVATRAQEATEGTSDTFLFDNVRKAIHDFKDGHEVMNALSRTAIRGLR